MKKYTVFLILGILTNNVFSQVEYVKQFNPINLGTIQNALNEKQSAYDKNKAYIDNLINWIFKLKQQTNDRQFLSSMDAYYKQLRSFDGKDLAALSNEIRKIDLGIKEEIDKHNTRISETNDPQKYLDSGYDLLEKQEYNLAIQDFSKVIQLAPEYSGSYLARGFSYYCLGDYANAIVDLTNYIRLDPRSPKGYEYRGWSQYYQQNFLGALSDFNKQIAIEPHSAVAYYNRGSAKSELNDQNGGIADYNKAIELDPAFSMAYNNIAWAKFNLQKYAEALIDANKAIDLDNQNYVAYDTRAEIKFNLNDYKGCISDCDLALEINPEIANSYLLKGRSYYHLGEINKACELWSKAGELGKAEAYKYISEYCNK